MENVRDGGCSFCGRAGFFSSLGGSRLLYDLPLPARPFEVIESPLPVDSAPGFEGICLFEARNRSERSGPEAMSGISLREKRYRGGKMRREVYINALESRTRCVLCMRTCLGRTAQQPLKLGGGRWEISPVIQSEPHAFVCGAAGQGNNRLPDCRAFLLTGLSSAGFLRVAEDLFFLW